MKKTVLLFVLMMASFLGLKAQIQTPAQSPAAKVEQRIGLVDISVEYSRPSMKGRKIFGDLVPYDTPWRTGANSATKITFSDDVTFGGAEVKKGAYALLTKPGEKTWTVMLYPYTNGSWDGYVSSDVQPVSVSAPVMKMPKNAATESFLIAFDNLTNKGGDLYFKWDDVVVAVPVSMNTDAAVEASIAKVMAGPTSNDYYSAASYYLSEKKNPKQALEWVNKAIGMGYEKFWVYRTKSLIHAELGDTQGAIDAALKSLELAKEAKSAEYIKMNEESLAQWRKG